MKNRRVLAVLLAVVVMIAMMPAMAFADTTTTTPTTTTGAETTTTTPGAGKTDETPAAPAKSNDIVILGTSDVHCGIDQNIGYAGLAAYKKAMAEKYNYVALVDAGDAIQGDTIGTLSKGEYLVDIMNEVGYDVVVPGNHEFDYGMDQFLNVIVPKMKATYVSANFMKGDKLVFDAYKMMTYGSKKVAFVGISTPETLVKSTPTYFQDKFGNYIYDFCNDKTGDKLYKAVQSAVDAAKKAGADYVVAVAHLGADTASEPWTSTDVIKNTTGIDALLDGHAHELFVKSVKNKDGKSIKMVATGTKLENIGKIVIAENGAITAEYIGADVAKDKDADVAKFIDSIKTKYDALVKTVVAKTDVDLIIADQKENRLVRSEETNLGDLCADAYKNVLGADIAFVNGGGIRVPIKKGNITYGDIIAVHPFGNMACVIEVTGQQILDALEFGSRNVGTGENGGFLQVSGLSYSIHKNFKTTVELNDKEEFVKVGGAYKVYDVKVNGEALDPTKTYTLASHNYMLKNGGDGFKMFKGSKVLQDEVMVDNQVLINYIQNNLKGVVGSEYAAPQGRIMITDTAPTVEPAPEPAPDQKTILKQFKTKVTSKKQKGAVKLTWKACTAVKGVKYQVYKSLKKAKGYKRVITTSKRTYTVKKLTKGKTYYFKVRAVKSIDGKNTYSKWSNVTYKKAA